MFQDNGLENYVWIPKVGDGIGSPGTPNPVITITQPTPSSEWLTVNTVGAGYADGLAKLARPLLIDPSNKGEFIYSYTIMTDSRTLTAAQALETTPRFFDENGWNYPGDFQVNYEENGMVQIWQNANNPWANTGIVIGKYTPNTPYAVEIDYTFNTETHTMSIPWFSVNGKVYEIPASMLNVAAADDLKWPAKFIYLQKQLDLNKMGGAFSVSYKNIGIIYPQT